MGFKNKLNKMKSFFFDEEDDELEVKKISKKPKLEKKKEIEVDFDIEIEAEDEKNDDIQEVEELFFDEEPEEETYEEIKPRSQKIESSFSFPDFDDDDFMVAPRKSEPVISIIDPEPKTNLYQGSKRKDEPKKFKPSPIISPIYGLIDTEGNTVHKESDAIESKYYKEEATFDEVRKKVYGAFEENFDNTIKRLSTKTIEEAEKEMEEELSKEKVSSKVVEEDPIVASKANDELDEEIVPNINFKEIDVDFERTKDYSRVKNKLEKEEIKNDFDDDDDDDTKEQDLFNLIDSMYQKEGNEE